MFSLFACYCKNQQFRRNIIKQSQTSFSSILNGIQMTINQLIHDREKLLRNQDLDQDLIFSSRQEKLLNSFLTKFKDHQRLPYKLFRKDLLQLAYKTYPIDRILCKRYIESVMVGDYQNDFKEEGMRQVFLAELYGIQYKTNYNGMAFEATLKSLTHWQNVVENHCLFYKQWKEEKSFDIDIFTENMEVVYYEQYLEGLVAVLRLFYQHGDFQKSKIYFEEARLKIEEAIEIISHFEKKLNKINGKYKENYNQFLEHHKNQFIQQLVNLYIIQIKTSIWEKKFALGQELLEEIQQRSIKNEEQKLLLNILKFDLMLFQKKNYQCEKIIEMSKFILQNIKQTNLQSEQKYLHYDMIWFIDDIYAFKVVYDGIEEDERQYLLTLFDNFGGSILEVYRNFQELKILQNNFTGLFVLSKELIHILQGFKYTKHYIWDSIIFSILLATYRIKDVKQLKSNIQEIQQITSKIDRPLQKIIDFFKLIVEFEETSQIHKINEDLLKKIKQIEFDQYMLKYQKQLAIEQMLNNYNLFNELDECYINQITLLCEYEHIYSKPLDQLYEKQKLNEL